MELILLERIEKLGAMGDVEKAVDDGKAVDGTDVIIIRKAGDTGHLYGSVSARDIAEELVGKGVKRNMIVLEQPIKALGLHTVKVRLHPEVSVEVTVNVARTTDEADRQARGEDVIATQIAEEQADIKEANQERAENAVSMFEGDAPEEFLAPDADGEASEEEVPAAKSEEE